MKTAVQILTETRELLSVRKRWTQRQMAKDYYGKSTLVHDKNAKCWCLLGAVFKNMGSTPQRLITPFLKRAIAMEGDRPALSIVRFNDTPTRKHEDILRVLDRAIELAKKEETSP